MTSVETQHQEAKELRKAVADWLLEVSALLAVFPWLDQLVLHARPPFDWLLTLGTLSIASGLASAGLAFLRPTWKVRVPYFTAGFVMSAAGVVLLLWR